MFRKLAVIAFVLIISAITYPRGSDVCGGPDPGICKETPGSGTTPAPVQEEAALVDEFPYTNREDTMLRVDQYLNILGEDESLRGYVVVRGDKRSRESAEKEIIEYLKQVRSDLKRHTIVQTEGTGNAVIQLWRVPEGAKPPVPGGPDAGKDSASDEIIGLEKQAWEEWKKGNKSFIRGYLADDAFFVYADGVMNKTQILSGVGYCKFNDYSLQDFRVKMLDTNAALITYTANQDIVCDGEAAPNAVRSTSVYVRRNGKWQSTFYTETAGIPGASSGQGMDASSLAALLDELKGVVTRMSPNKDEAIRVVERWNARKDLNGRTRSEVIDLLYEDVKAEIKDSGTQYEIYSAMSFYKRIGN